MTVHGKDIKIQEEMIKVIKIHHKVMWVLTAIIVLSAIATFYCNYFLNKTGRYTISGGKGGVYVLDTKTSQLWQRAGSPRENLYFGTNDNPTGEVISRRVKVKTFEEIGIKSEKSETNK